MNSHYSQTGDPIPPQRAHSIIQVYPAFFVLVLVIVIVIVIVIAPARAIMMTITSTSTSMIDTAEKLLVVFCRSRTLRY